MTYTIRAAVETTNGYTYPHTRSGLTEDQVPAAKETVKRAILRRGDTVTWSVTADK